MTLTADTALTVTSALTATDGGEHADELHEFLRYRQPDWLGIQREQRRHLLDSAVLNSDFSGVHGSSEPGDFPTLSPMRVPAR